MNRNPRVLSGRARSVQLLLALALLTGGGCSSNGGDDRGGAMAKIAGSYGLEPSEYIAIKKANKNAKDFEKAVLQQKVAKLKAAGAVVETTEPGKRIRGGR